MDVAVKEYFAGWHGAPSGRLRYRVRSRRGLAESLFVRAARLALGPIEAFHDDEPRSCSAQSMRQSRLILRTFIPCPRLLHGGKRKHGNPFEVGPLHDGFRAIDDQRYRTGAFDPTGFAAIFGHLVGV